MDTASRQSLVETSLETCEKSVANLRGHLLALSSRLQVASRPLLPKTLGQEKVTVTKETMGIHLIEKITALGHEIDDLCDMVIDMNGRLEL